MSEGTAEAEQVLALASAMAHPVRSQVLSALSLNVSLGAEELAGLLDQPIRSVRYQLGVLADAELVGIEREERRRGASKRFYYLARRPLITDEQEAALTVGVRTKVSLQILRLILADAAAAASSGDFTRRSDRVIARVAGEVDARGWKELSEIQHAALQGVEQVMARSRERLSTEPEDPIAITAAMFLFERAGKREDAG